MNENYAEICKKLADKFHQENDEFKIASKQILEEIKKSAEKGNYDCRLVRYKRIM